MDDIARTAIYFAIITFVLYKNNTNVLYNDKINLTCYDNYYTEIDLRYYNNYYVKMDLRYYDDYYIEIDLRYHNNYCIKIISQDAIIIN